jgi:hypothetical protein
VQHDERRISAATKVTMRKLYHKDTQHAEVSAFNSQNL